MSLTRVLLWKKAQYFIESDSTGHSEFFPVYSELTLFWIKICILPHHCKKRFIFTSCYRAAVKQMTRRRRDFFSSELKGMWAVKVVRQKTPYSGANIKWSSRQEKAECEDLQLKTRSVRVKVNALATFCKIGRAKENRNLWLKSRGRLLLQELVSLQFLMKDLDNVLEEQMHLRKVLFNHGQGG